MLLASGPAVAAISGPATVTEGDSYSLTWSFLGARLRLSPATGGSATSIWPGSSATFTNAQTGTYTYIEELCVALFDTQSCASVDTHTVTVNARTPVPPPPVPTGLNVPSTNDTGRYSAMWNASSGATRYQLQERTNSGGWRTVHNRPATRKSFSGKRNATYHYRVRACAASCSGWSGADSVRLVRASGTPGPVPEPLWVPVVSGNGTTMMVAAPPPPPAVIAPPVDASITAPTSVPVNTSFSVQWSGPGSHLRVTDPDGGQTVHYGGSTTLNLSAGLYTLTERACYEWPANFCVTFDATTVDVVGNTAPPMSLSDQMRNIDYEVRAGDFNSDGYSDLFIDRLTAGNVDGTLQSTILYRQPTGTFDPHIPTAMQAGNARTYPFVTELEPCLTDHNLDGFADMILENVAEELGVTLDDVIVFASGQNNVAMPGNALSLSQSVMQFMYDVQQASIDPNYYVANTSRSVRPIFATFINCLDFGTFGISFLPSSCTISVFPVGIIVNVGIGYNPNSPAFSIPLLDILNTAHLSTSDGNWWALAQAFETIYGVYAFGFRSDGSREPTGYAGIGIPTPDETGELSQIGQHLIVNYLWQSPDEDDNVPPPEDWVPHSYGHTDFICDPAHPLWGQWCTIENILCWMQRLPANRSDEDPEGSSISRTTNGQEVTLFPDEHILVHHQGDSVINETVDPHVFHDDHATRGCGALDPIPDRCAVVVRTVQQAPNGTLEIVTKGTGYNETAAKALSNEVAGSILFRFINREIISAVRDTQQSCATWTPPNA